MIEAFFTHLKINKVPEAVQKAARELGQSGSIEFLDEKTKLTLYQLQSKFMGNIVENLPEFLKPFIANEHGALSGKKLPNLIKFLENSENPLLKNASDELKQTGRITCLGTKADFENYINFKFLKNQATKRILEVNDIKILKNKYNLSDEQLMQFFPNTSGYQTSSVNYFVNDFLDLLDGKDAKKDVSEIMLKQVFGDEEYFNKLFTGSADNDLQRIIKALDFVGDDLKQKFFSKLPHDMPLKKRAIIGKILDDNAKKSIIENLNTDNDISDSLKSKYISDLVISIKDPDMLQEMAQKSGKYCCNNKVFNILVDKNPELLKDLYYKSEQDGALEYISNISTNIIEKLFNDEERIKIINRINEASYTVPNNLIESMQDPVLQEEIIAKCPYKENNYYLIKNKISRDKLTSEFFDRLKNRSNNGDSCKKILFTTLEKCDDPEYIKNVVDHCVQVVNPVNYPLLMNNLSPLTRIKDEEILGKVVSIIDAKSFTNISSNLTMFKQIFNGIKNPEVKSAIGKKILLGFNNPDIYSLEEYSFPLKYLNDQQMKRDCLTKMLAVIEEHPDCQFEKNVYMNMIDTVRSLNDRGIKKDLVRHVAALKNRVYKDSFINLDEFANAVKNTDPKMYRIDDIFSHIASGFLKDGIEEEDIIKFLLTSNKPENLPKVLMETEKFKSYLENNLKELSFNNNLARQMVDMIDNATSFSSSENLRESAIEAIQAIRNLGIDIGTLNLDEILIPEIKGSIADEIKFAQENMSNHLNNVSLDETILKFVSESDKNEIPDRMLALKTMVPGFDEAYNRVLPQLDSNLVTAINSKLTEYISLDKALSNCNTVGEFIQKYPQFDINCFQFNADKDLVNLQDLVYTDKTRKALKEFLIQETSDKNNEMNLFNDIRLIGYGNVNDILKKDGMINFPAFDESINTLVKESSYTNIKKMEEVFSLKGINGHMSRKMLNIICGYSEFGDQKILGNALDKIIDNKNQNKPLKVICNEAEQDFFNTFTKRIGIPHKYTVKTPEIIEKWDLENFPGLGHLFTNIDKTRQKWLRQLIKSTYNREEYKKMLFDKTSDIGKLNIETMNIFKKEGLDFNEWMRHKDVGEFSYAADIEEQLQGIRDFVNEDINSLMMSSISQDIKNFIDNVELSSRVKLIFKENKLRTAEGEELSRDMLQDFVGKFSAYMSENKKWSILKQNYEDDILDLKDHFKARLAGLKSLKSTIASAENGNLSIKLWKREPERDLFLGDYCQCCISPTGINGHAIIDSLMHVVDQTIKLEDSAGNTVGKAKVLWIKDMTNGGKPALLVNGFEMAARYQNSTVIRDNMMGFLKGYAKSVAKNQKHIKIYTGESYQRLPINDLERVEINAKLIGEVRDNTYHLDSFKRDNYGDKATSWPKNLDQKKSLALRVLGET